jgi:adenylyl-sulfate kinase
MNVMIISYNKKLKSFQNLSSELNEIDKIVYAGCDLLPIEELYSYISNSRVLLQIIDPASEICVDALWSLLVACLSDVPRLFVVIDNSSSNNAVARAQGELIRRRLKAFVRDIGCHNIHVLNSDEVDGELIPALTEIRERPVDERKLSAEAEESDQFAVYLNWRSEIPLLPGRHYVFDNGRQQTECFISSLKYRFNPETLDRQAARRLHAGEIGYANLALDDPVSFKPLSEDLQAGSFCLREKGTGEILCHGIIRHSLRRATNIRWQPVLVSKQERAALNGHKPFVLWFTGLSGAGKSTIAAQVERRLHEMGMHTYLMDGDNIRHGLCRDLGFTEADRVENMRRLGEVARLMVDAGLIVLVAVISPFRAERRMVREMFEEGEFLEIFVDTPLEECERRDVKGLYRKAREGRLKNFTGIDSPYEPPENPEIHICGTAAPVEKLAEEVLDKLRKMYLLYFFWGCPRVWSQ